MKKIITAEAARNLVSRSEERKEKLIEKMNYEIESQSKKGLRWDTQLLIGNN